MRTASLFVAACAGVAILSQNSAEATLSPLSSFRGDGWFAPGEDGYTFLGTANNERGMAYNPATGHLILVSRSGGTNIRILDGTSGADLGALNNGTGIITGGTFVVNMPGVGDDGAIYVGNLSTSATAPFKVYRWENEAAAEPTVAFNAVSGVDRTGDSFDAFGSGVNTVLAAAGSATTNRSNFVSFSTADGLAYTNTAYLNIAGTTTTSNDYRLALSFLDGDTVIGNQGANGRVTSFSGGTAIVDASIPLGVAQRPLDYAVIGGVPVLAVIDTGSSLVQVFDITTPSSPLLIDSGNLTSGTLTGNANGTGSVRWGAISGPDATLYAMSSNQGIQAFSFSIPEPASLSLLAAGATVLVRRRRA